MQKALLIIATSAAILAAPALTPAQAMTVGTAAGVQTMLDETSAVQDVAYVCRHRRWNSVRRCWWQPHRHRHWHRRWHRHR